MAAAASLSKDLYHISYRDPVEYDIWQEKNVKKVSSEIYQLWFDLVDYQE